MITSTHNARIQHIRRLQSQRRARREAGAFVVEGVRLVEEALHAGWEAQLVLHLENLAARGMDVVRSFAALGAQVEAVTPQVLDAISDTETPQGLLAVLALKPLPLPPAPDFVLILDGVRDPGNLGTILRTSAAAGVQAVLLPPGSADAYAPKVVRSAMGAHFRMPVCSMDWEGMRIYLNPPIPPRPRLYLADSAGGQSYNEADFTKPVALVVGGEATGASQQTASLADERLHIPMPGGMESLNAAIAAAILIFEVVRQRGNLQTL
ncbi:MAG: RNA methyltransferase [Anaerolineales bacterium]|nr:RNA methyltransferase [Anaerolineales bacterium]